MKPWNLLLCLLASSSAFAAKKPAGPPPAISGIFPDGGKVGSTFSCKIDGTLTKSATKAWADHAGLVFKATKKPDTFEVTIAPEVPLGPHLVRFFNDDGASPPRIFLVGNYDEATDTEPNDDFRKPQVLPKLPVMVNGRMEKAGDVDVFAVKVEAGHWLVCDLQGYALGSPMDPAMKVLDERGVELAGSHDTHNLDPFIAYQVKATGTYLVEVMAFAHPPAADVTLKGAATHIYRLTLTDQPYAKAAWPCAVQRGAQNKPKLLGWNFGPKMEGPELTVDTTPFAASDEIVRLPTPHGELVLASVVNSSIVMEVEPNNNFAQAQRVTLPCTLAGRIDAPKDEDRFLFSAKKGENLEFRVRSFALHSPMDAWVRVEDKLGKTLAQADDEKEGSFDPILKWKSPADGDYVLAIGDLFSRGGWEYVYAIEAGVAPQRIAATLDASAYKLEAGKTVEVKLTTKLSGEFKGKLLVHADGLPTGVTAKEPDLTTKGGELKLTLTATAEAAPSNQPFGVTITTSAPDAPQTFKASFDIPVTEPRGDRLMNEDTRAWLTVIGKAAEAEKPAVPPAPVAGEKK